MSKIKQTIQLGTVQETLLIPLWARAMETSRPDAIIRDPLSAQILEQIDYDFSKLAQAQSTQVGVCLRGVMFDEWVKDFLRQNPSGAVIEVGAGLNTRFERVDNGRANWIEVDLPDAIKLRQQFFGESDHRKILSGSLLDSEWMEQVRTQYSGPFLIVIEAVLMYLTEVEVKQAFALLSKYFAGSLVAFDSLAPMSLKSQDKHDSMRHFSARFQWAIQNVKEIQRWDPSYKVIQVKTFWESPAQHRRRLAPWWIRFLYACPPFRNAYRLALIRLT
ncbi:MAG: class I SAM-dependent methyltransferase [Thermostichus sp. DG02_5_bins_236]